MKLLHTSDWHIGRKFERESLEDNQREFLAWVTNAVIEHNIDLVIIAGDVYDRSMPGEDAVELLDEGLDALRATGATIALISGNHDSATRLGFGARRQAAGGIHVFSKTQDAPAPWVFEKDGERLVVLGIPFLDPYGVPAPRPASDGSHRPRTHENVLADALEDGRAALALLEPMPSLVIAHAFVRGATSSDSEKLLSIGGTDAVPSNLFEGFDYVALGHLHRPQLIEGKEHIAYSGSPLPYSFSEEHPKSVRIVTITDGALASVETLPIPVGRRVARLTDTLENLLSDSAYDQYEDFWVAARLTNDVPQVQAMERLRTRYPYVVTIRHGNERSPLVGNPSEGLTELVHRTPEEVVFEFLDELLEGAPTQSQRDLVVEAANAALREEQS